MISFLYDFIYMFPIYIVSLILMSNVLNIPERGVVFYILAVLLMGLISCIKNLANSLSILITGIFSVIVAGIILVQKPDQRIVYIHEHLWVGWMLLIGVAIFILGRLIIASKWIRRLSAILLIAVATTIMLKNVQIDRIVITLIFFELLIYLIDAIQSTWEKSGETDNKKHLVFVAPWIVAIGIIVSLVKVSDKPYDWNFVRMANQRIVEIAKLSTNNSS